MDGFDFIGSTEGEFVEIIGNDVVSRTERVDTDFNLITFSIEITREGRNVHGVCKT